MNLNYLLCPSYHGATLLAILLDRHPRITCLGDTVPRFQPDEICTCQQTFAECSFWSNLIAKVKSTPGADPERLIPISPFKTEGRINSLKTWTMTAMAMTFGPSIWKMGGEGARNYCETHQTFREEACKLLGTSEFVDGEKSLKKIFMLNSMTDSATRPRIIHLTRDPRGYHNSRLKYEDGVTPENTAKAWMHHNWYAKLANPLFGCDYMRIRYEDLCMKPTEYMNQIFNFLGLSNEDVCNSGYVPAQTHTIGNKMRKTFDGTISLDEAWRQNLDSSTQSTIANLTEPLFSQLGYS